MWLSRRNSANSNKTSPIRRTPPSFNRQSFKNLEDLLVDDDNNNVSSSTHSSDLNNEQPQPQQQPQQQPSSSSPIPSTAATAKRHSVFHRVRLANQVTRSFAGRHKHIPEKSPSELNNAAVARKWEKSAPLITIPGAEKRIVVYLTSLRVVRPTFEACRCVRSILQGFRVAVDERDLSMDSSFLDELQKIMSQGRETIPKTSLTLPQVFIGGRYVGEAEEVRQMNETGELKKLLEALPPVSRGVCEVCRDFRYIICNECNGSRKWYKEKGGFRNCTVCNENGLIRCPSCWSR